MKAKRHARQQTVAKAERAATATSVRHAGGTAAAALAKLPVKGRAPKTGYSREQFGDGWIDTGGCDTRDRILTRDLTAKTYLDDCRVESGTLADPYTGERVHYTRGGASEVDIDHVVALSDAWQKGAQQWAAGDARRVRQRPAEPARRRRAHQPFQGRRGRRHLAAPQQGVPLRLRRPPGRRQDQVQAVGHPSGEGRDRPRARHVSGPEAPRARRAASR